MAATIQTEKAGKCHMARSTARVVAGITSEQQGEGHFEGRTVTNLQETRVDQLIRKIRPAQHSEQRRHFVAQHVKSLIAKCFQPDHEVLYFCTPLPDREALSCLPLC